jgi:hypothetical protein
MKYEYEQKILPEELKTIPVSYVNTPNQPLPNNKTRRSNTGDTIKQWIEQEKPQSSSCLFISSQPYTWY